jgi:hypothetical protein
MNMTFLQANLESPALVLWEFWIFFQSLSTTASSKLLWLSSLLVPVTQTCTDLVLKSASHFPELFHG